MRERHLSSSGNEINSNDDSPNSIDRSCKTNYRFKLKAKRKTIFSTRSNPLLLLQSLHQVQSSLFQLAESRQEIVVLRQDKDYLTRQSNDLQQKFYSAEEKISTLELSLDETKRAKELLYEKHISTRFVSRLETINRHWHSREAYKTEYENKLAIELEQLRGKTGLEIEKLRDSVKEMYERENRSVVHLAFVLEKLFFAVQIVSTRARRSDRRP